MNVLLSLLPGLREIRAPLVSGYLWLLAAWLALVDHLPTASDDSVVGELVEELTQLSDAALLVVVSLGAYLVGSLAQAVLRFMHRYIQRVVDTGDAGDYLSDRQVPVARLMEPPFYSLELGALEGDRQVYDGLLTLTTREFQEPLDQLHGAIHEVEGTTEESGISPALRLSETRSVRPKLSAMLGNHAVRTVSAPSFLAQRDIFHDKNLLLSRLVEASPVTGNRIGQLYAESELRFAIAWPVAACGVVLTVREGIPWLALLIVAGLLAAHGLMLHRQASGELIDALRARQGDELRKITPVFETYKRDLGALTDLLTSADWGLEENQI